MVTIDEVRREQIERDRAERVPICGSHGITIPRAIWDEAWLGYGKTYPGSNSESQFYRLLNEGFYESELDSFRPGWRPVQTQLDTLARENERLIRELAAKDEERAGLRAELVSLWAIWPTRQSIADELTEAQKEAPVERCEHTLNTTCQRCAPYGLCHQCKTGIATNAMGIPGTAPLCDECKKAFIVQWTKDH